MIRPREYAARLSIIFLFFGTLFAAIIVRLYRLQVVQHELFVRLATQQYSVQVELPTSRGLLCDRHGTPLTLNQERLSAFILPQQLKYPTETHGYLKNNFPQVYKLLLSEPKRKFLWLARSLTPEKQKELALGAPKDIQFLEEERRHYPYTWLIPLLGRTDIDNKGIAGLELFFEHELAGTPTHCRLERDGRSLGHYVSKEVILSGLEGHSVQLSIDHELQFLAEQEVESSVKKFRAQSGAALVMNPDTGEILAMASFPYESESGEEIKNSAVTDSYELGSVIKIFSALACLAEKVVTPDEEIDCEGKSATFGNFTVENWVNLGTLPFRDVVVHSSNVGIAKATQRLGNDLYYHHLKRLGFGEKCGLEFPGECCGTLAHPSKWSKYSILSMSYGYEVAASLVQLARALSIIANGGYDITPTLRYIEGQDRRGLKLYQASTITTLKEILATIGAKYGPAKVRCMGKTGTARLAQKGGYSESRHIYTFGGIVEKGDYRRVIVTFVKEPKGTKLWASQVAAPLFGKIAERLVVHDRLQKNAQLLA